MKISTKLALKLPVWQKKFLSKIIKEQQKAKPNQELLQRAKQACFKTGDQNFIFVYATCCNDYEYLEEAIRYLLKANIDKWAIPCSKELLLKPATNTFVEMK